MNNEYEEIQSRLVSLTASEVTQNDRLDEIDEDVQALREILEGVASDKQDNGLKGDIHDLFKTYSELRALMMPDHLGNGGVINRLKALEKREEKELRIGVEKWKFYAVLLGLVGTLTWALLSNLDHIQSLLRNTDPLDQAIEKAKHPRGKKIIRLHVVAPEPESE